MNLTPSASTRKTYVKPTLKITYIELEDCIAASSVQPINNHTEVKEQWDELGNVFEDVEW
ncbi:hypothetical protein [Sphingobacterium paucimobilis]|uniref:Uncharacterized protein n=1 Tax=Sphingobacterium paucimobilis HER1398 TaxID=1346330 RepID=U2HC85_9SPHI|nr:hypothetical protein [Sphingobacterium paucimobilis]ERJ59366.1 hypothetical protein M472_11335 [Sphingobacterium paucimobilis HER1398]